MATFRSNQLPDNILKRMPRPDRPKGNAGLTNSEAKAKHDGRLEKELQKQIANWLRLNGVFFVRSRMDKRTTVTPGTPDFVLAIEGNPVALEAKTQSDLSEDQIKVRAQMLANGWAWAQVTTLAEAKSVVEHIRNGTWN